MVDIFQAAKESTIVPFMKFVNAGDKVQGTYVGKIINVVDGYGNAQIIYQLLKDDGTVVNTGWGLNKKVMHKEMMSVRFGQIIGFTYKGMLTVKDKFGKPVNVKDYGLFQDPKIVNEKWLQENQGNMPVVIDMAQSAPAAPAADSIEARNAAEVSNFGVTAAAPVTSTAPAAPVTPADKLATIEKLAKEKLGVADPTQMKDKVMEVTGIAFIPANYDRIISLLGTI